MQGACQPVGTEGPLVLMAIHCRQSLTSSSDAAQTSTGQPGIDFPVLNPGLVKTQVCYGSSAAALTNVVVAQREVRPPPSPGALACACATRPPWSQRPCSPATRQRPRYRARSGSPLTGAPRRRADLQPDLQHHLLRLPQGHQPAAAELHLARALQRGHPGDVLDAVLLPGVRRQRRLHGPGVQLHEPPACAPPLPTTVPYQAPAWRQKAQAA